MIKKLEKYSKKRFLEIGVKSFELQYFYFNHFFLFSLFLFSNYFLIVIISPFIPIFILSGLIIVLASIGSFFSLDIKYNDVWLKNTYVDSENFNNEFLAYISGKTEKNEKISEKFHLWYLKTEVLLFNRKKILQIPIRIIVYTVILFTILFDPIFIKYLIENEISSSENLLNNNNVMILWCSLTILLLLFALAYIESYSNRFRYIFDNICEHTFKNLVNKKNNLVKFNSFKKCDEDILDKIREQLDDILNFYNFNIFGEFIQILQKNSSEFELNSLHSEKYLLKIISNMYEIETFLFYLEREEEDKNITFQIQVLMNYLKKIRKLIKFELNYRQELIEKPKNKRNRVFQAIISIIIPPVLTYLLSLLL